MKQVRTFFKWPRERTKSVTAIFILYFIWPFGAWLRSLKNANKRSSYIIFFLFSLLLCWHLSPNGDENVYDDFLGILDRFVNTDFTYNEILDQLKNYFTFAEDAPKEIYENILIFLVKSFTNNYHFYFLLCAIPVAFLQLGCLKYLTQDAKYRPQDWYAIACIIMFIYARDIITVQNPRFSTGFWICMYCIMSYFLTEKGNRLKLLPIVFTPMIHSGMWLMVIIVVSYFFIPKKIRMLEYLAFISIPFSFLDSSIIHSLDLSVILPPSLYKWSLNHFNPEQSHQVVGSGFWWVGASFNFAVKFMYLYMFFKLVKTKNNILQNVILKNFYLFFLFLFIVVNLVQGIPVLGERYFWFLKALIIVFWFKSLYPKYSKVMLALILANVWGFVFRYGYVLGGALAVNTPTDIFWAPLPYLLGKGIFW